MNFLKKYICKFFAILIAFPIHLLAQNSQPFISQLLRDSSQSTTNTSSLLGSQSQYRFSPVSDPGLMAIHVIGSVRKPGIHYLPPKSNLLEVIALAGGTTENAQVDAISISTLRPSKNSPQRGRFDLEDYFERADRGELNLEIPTLLSNDVIYIPEDKPIIDRDTATIVALIGAIASTVLSVVIIRREIKD